MSAFRKFKVGEKVRILDDRRESWQEREELEIVKVHEHGFRFEVGHNQTLLTAEAFINDARYGCILALSWIKGVRAVLKTRGGGVA